jgi:polyisoprenoid-binding protein YceI
VTDAPAAAQGSRFTIAPDASAVLVEARSSVGLISFGTTKLTGFFRGRLNDGEVDLSVVPSASLTLPVASLTSGNPLYDSEIRTRLHAQRFPTIDAELESATGLGGGRYAVHGDLTIHGETRPQTGTLTVTVEHKRSDGADDEGQPDTVTLTAMGSLTVDIRDFDIELPSLLLLQIYPDVTVRFRATARPDQAWRPEN